MLRKLAFVSFVYVCLVLRVPCASAQQITLYTEEFPPFNMTENNEVTGVSTEVVANVMSTAGIAYTIESYPWARTYKLAQKGPTSLIYSISRRAKRENLFRWIGIIVPTVQSVFSLKSRTDIDIKELAEMKNYKIGTTLQDSREIYLLNNGFTEDDLMRASGDNSYFLNYKKLKQGRIDLWPMPDAVAFYLVKQAGDDPSETIQKVFEFEEMSKSGYYIAASLDVPEETVETIRESLEEFKKTPEYENILKKWGLARISHSPSHKRDFGPGEDGDPDEAVGSG